MTAIGIDIGGTNVKAVRVDGSGTVLDRREEPTPAEAEAILGVVRRMAELGDVASPIGIAAPGLAARDNRSIHWMRGRMESVQGLNFGDRLGRPVAVLNDAHAAILGEAWVGAAAGRRHVVMLTLGTGVGGGVIADGELLQGRVGRAGHLGHLTLDHAAPKDIVKTAGSLEDLVGDHTVRDRTGGRFADTRALLEAAKAGDAEAAGHWDQTVRVLATGVASLVNIFDPEIVLLGGGISAAGDDLLSPLRRWMDEYEWRPTDEAVEIRVATLGTHAGAIGAARFAMTQENA